MKHKLTPEASGTLVALYQGRRLKFFCPESADELIAAGFAQKEHENLSITPIGIRAARTVYVNEDKTAD